MIYIRRPLVGHQAVEDMFASFQQSVLQCDFTVCDLTVLSILVVLHLVFLLYCFLELPIGCCWAPLDSHFTTHLACCLSLGSSRDLWKIIKFQAPLQDPNKREKVSPRPPTDSKMTPKTSPLDTKFMNTWKKWNLSKTTVFNMF